MLRSLCCFCSFCFTRTHDLCVGLSFGCSPIDSLKIYRLDILMTKRPLGKIYLNNIYSFTSLHYTHIRLHFCSSRFFLCLMLFFASHCFFSFVLFSCVLVCLFHFLHLLFGICLCFKVI